MNKYITLFLGAALVAPLFLSAPAQAQSYHDIQRLEQQVQDAKNNGNWAYAQQLERQLNQERRAYQLRNGQGEIQQGYQYYYEPGYQGYYNNGYYNNGYNNGYNNNGYYNNGYYHREGRHKDHEWRENHHDGRHHDRD